jgi:hypothetical protein
MSDVFVRCGDCKHFITELEEFRAEDELNDPELGHLGHCDAVDTTSLPYTWRYTTLKHRLAVISNSTVYVHDPHRYSSHLGLMAQWLNENNLVLTHHADPNRYHIGRI